MHLCVFTVSVMYEIISRLSGDQHVCVSQRPSVISAPPSVHTPHGCTLIPVYWAGVLILSVTVARSHQLSSTHLSPLFLALSHCYLPASFWSPVLFVHFPPSPSHLFLSFVPRWSVQCWLELCWHYTTLPLFSDSLKLTYCHFNSLLVFIYLFYKGFYCLLMLPCFFSSVVVTWSRSCGVTWRSVSKQDIRLWLPPLNVMWNNVTLPQFIRCILQ